MPRTRRGASASAFTRVFVALWVVNRRAWTKIAKTTPCKVETGPGSEQTCRTASGAREEEMLHHRDPNLISSRSRPGREPINLKWSADVRLMPGAWADSLFRTPRRLNHFFNYVPG